MKLWYCDFSNISWILEGIIMEHINIQVSSDCKLQFGSICSIRVPSRTQKIASSYFQPICTTFLKPSPYILVEFAYIFPFLCQRFMAWSCCKGLGVKGLAQKDFLLFWPPFPKRIIFAQISRKMFKHDCVSVSRLAINLCQSLAH